MPVSPQVGSVTGHRDHMALAFDDGPPAPRAQIALRCLVWLDEANLGVVGIRRVGLGGDA